MFVSFTKITYTYPGKEKKAKEKNKNTKQTLAKFRACNLKARMDSFRLIGHGGLSCKFVSYLISFLFLGLSLPFFGCASNVQNVRITPKTWEIHTQNEVFFQVNIKKDDLFWKFIAAFWFFFCIVGCLSDKLVFDLVYSAESLPKTKKTKKTKNKKQKTTNKKQKQKNI